MNPRIDPTAPANMSPDERLAEVASILADGMLRLCQRWLFRPQIPQSFPLSNLWNMPQMALRFLPAKKTGQLCSELSRTLCGLCRCRPTGASTSRHDVACDAQMAS